MNKDFFKWHTIKAEIENEHFEKLFREREIWWCSLGMNIGFEQDGKNERFERPVLVLKKFNKGMFWGIPITSKYKEGKFYFPFNIKKEIMVAILSQLRVLSSKRLIRRLSKMLENKFYKFNLEVIDFHKIKTDPLKGSSSA